MNSQRTTASFRSFLPDGSSRAFTGFVPSTAGNRLCAKEVIDRSVLLRLQAEMPKILQGKGFQIERGEGGSAAVHKSVKTYKADMEKESIFP